MTAVREVEMRLASGAGAACDTAEIPPGIISDPDVYAKVMNELMVMALRCDMTRVISFMLGNGGSLRFYAFLEVYGLHHEISHHQGLEENFRMLETIGRWEREQFADLIARMKESRGARWEHPSRSLTRLLRQRDRRRKPTQSRSYPYAALRAWRRRRLAWEAHCLRRRSAARLFVSMLQNACVDSESFGIDGDGPLDGLS